MMELKVIDDQGAGTSTVAASDTLFARDYNESLVHQLVVAYQANARLGTRKQLGRSEVNKTKKKPFRQKGTGRARAGKASSPLWRGGGKIFPNTPDENFEQKVNRKMYRAGMATILSQLAREDRLKVVDSFSVEQPKTKLLAQKVKAMGLDEVLVITDQLDDNTFLAARNLPNVLVLSVNQANPVSLVQYENVLLTKNAKAKFEEMWGGGQS
jgi:large subunit ribosomal protein L4